MLPPLPQPPIAVGRIDVTAPPEEPVEERLRESEVGGRGVRVRHLVEELLLEALPVGLLVPVLPLVRRNVAQVLLVFPELRVDVIERTPVELLRLLVGELGAGEVGDRRLERV